MNELITLLKKCILVIILLTTVFSANQAFGQGQVINPTSPWIVPAGVTSIKVEVWGAGGGGGGSQGTGFSGTSVGSGGGGGAYNVMTLAVSPGQSYTINIGAGGTVGDDANGGTGGNTIVSGVAGTVTANGGTGGGRRGGNAGTGGIGFNNGGNGGVGSSNGAGGGGGAGNRTPTLTGNGGAGANGAGGAAGPGALPGGAGAGAQSGGDNNGNNGAVPGGGGGGGRSSGFFKGANSGGIGGAGQVVITYTCPSATISYTSSGFCKSATSASVTINGSTGGTFSVIPSSGLTINGAGLINPSTSTAGTYTVHYKFAAGNGCPAVDAIATVKINALPVATVPDQTNVNCYGGADGTITVSATGGTTPYTFSIDNGSTFESQTGTNLRQFTGLQANTPYTIKVKDANGCISN